ncbi:MAG: enoyl-CoA hydratase/isomerase family protein [Pseudomonadota bacterium]
MASVTTETRGRTRLIRYGNPPRHYMTAEGSIKLAEAIGDAAGDDGIRAIVLTGTDDVFVRHFDVSEIVQAGKGVAAGALQKQNFETGPFVALQDACFNAPKPVICAINGTCMGGGFEIALASDLRIADSTVTQIGLPETRLSIFPGGGGTQRLPRVIGEAAALDFILRGRVVDAAQALSMGLVHETAPDALARALEVAAEFEARGAAGVAMAKSLVRNALSRPIEDGLMAERHGFFDVLKTEDAMAAMRTFLETGEDITA